MTLIARQQGALLHYLRFIYLPCCWQRLLFFEKPYSSSLGNNAKLVFWIIAVTFLCVINDNNSNSYSHCIFDVSGGCPSEAFGEPFILFLLTM
jgi:hypothetical protein